MNLISIRKTANGREYWQCSFSLPDHRRVRFLLGSIDKMTKTQAESLARKRYRDELDNFTGVKQCRVTLSEAIEIFFKTLKESPGLVYRRRGVKLEVDEVYIRNYKIAFNRAVKYFGGDCDLSTLHRERIESMIEHYRKSLKPSSINKILIGLRQLSNLLIVKSLIKVDFMLKIRQLPVDDKPCSCFTDQQIDSLIHHAPEHLKNIIILATLSGLRRSELSSLKWEQVDFQQRVIHLYQNKSGKYQQCLLSDKALQFLRELRLTDPANSYDDYVLKYQGKQVKDWKKSFSRLMRELGIKGQSFHRLRHAFITQLIRRGIDVYRVSKIARHGDVKTTQRYIHLANNDLLDCLNSTDTGFGTNLAHTKKQSV